jgi:hypothetical protein
LKKGLLSEEAKDFATSCFARFMRPGQVIAAIEERYEVTIDRRQIQHYDPTTAKGQTLGKKRKALFEAVRKRFLEELDEIPIANKAVRLQQLQEHYNRAVDGKVPNVRLALEVLEKAAKEAGGVHTNEHKVHHTGRVATVPAEPVTEDEMRNGLAAAIASALAEEAKRLQGQGVTKH